MIWVAMASACVGPLGFIKTKVTPAVYQEIRAVSLCLIVKSNMRGRVVKNADKHIHMHVFLKNPF